MRSNVAVSGGAALINVLTRARIRCRGGVDGECDCGGGSAPDTGGII
jgi:hypothetical protein